MIEHLETSYAMYDAIHSQITSVDSIVSDNANALQTLADLHAKSHATTLVGIGSSLHSAQLAVALWRDLNPATYVTAAHSFDVANGLTTLRPQTLGDSAGRHLVVVLSHRGTKRYTNQALLMAKELGTMTCAITGKGVGLPSTDADAHLTTVEQERSSAHTASLIGSFAVLAAAIGRVSPNDQKQTMDALKGAITAGIACEEAMRAAAGTIPTTIRNLWIAGGGSDAVVAREVALKIKETSYIPTEGMSVEEFVHGPFQCVEPTDRILLIDTQPVSSLRISNLRAMAEVVGVPSYTVTTNEIPSATHSEIAMVSFPANPIPTLNSISALVALQLFTYFLALERGTNPDSFRLDDPRFKSAASLIQL